MKNKVLYMTLLLMAVLSLGSCDKDTEGLTRVTAYPTIELKGDATMILQKGTPYTEPGYSSTMNGEDVSDGVTVEGSVNPAQSGIYQLTYSTVKNADGFGASAQRKVVVYDKNDAIDGYYTCSMTSHREYKGASKGFADDFTILLFNEGGGKYYVSDMFGGWYDQGSQYGDKYAMVGHFQLNADNTVSLVDSQVAGWGDSLNSFTGHFDPATHTLTVEAVYAGGMKFVMTWVKQ